MSFFPLSHTFYFETCPSPLSKIGENAFGALPVAIHDFQDISVLVCLTSHCNLSNFFCKFQCFALWGKKNKK